MSYSLNSVKLNIFNSLPDIFNSFVSFTLVQIFVFSIIQVVADLLHGLLLGFLEFVETFEA